MNDTKLISQISRGKACEDSPAEAVETIEARFPELNNDLIRMASTGNTGSLTEWGRFIERLQSALRAQPQAREDAQPVASAYRVRPEMNDPEEWTLMHPERAFDYLDRPGWETQPLYTHPAPDALRVALSDAMVEAACSRFVSESDDIWSDSVWPEGPDDDGDRGDGGRVRLISEADQHNIRSAMRFAMTDALAALQAEQKGSMK